MPSEPNWSKQIDNSSVCTWFYALAILNGIAGAAGVLWSLYLLTKGKTTFGSYVFVLLYALFGFTNAWFFFLVCSRGLRHEGFENEEEEENRKEGFEDEEEENKKEGFRIR